MRHPPVLLNTPSSAAPAPVPASSAACVSSTAPAPASCGSAAGPAVPRPGSAASTAAPASEGSAQLPATRRYAAVRLLTGETLHFDIEVKSKGKELNAAVVRHLSSLGMKNADLFGLAILVDGEYLFIDPDNKLGKYAPKGWKSSHASGLDNAGQPLLVLYFRVKFYVDSHLLIRDRVTRHHYYLQMRENVLHHGHATATEESFFRLAALALQADFSDMDPDRHRGLYFDPPRYFPQWILERVGVDYVVQNLPAMHRDHQGLSAGSAQLLYIKESSAGPANYGLHLYRLRSSKKGDKSTERSTSLDRSTERSASRSKSDKLEATRNNIEQHSSRTLEREHVERFDKSCNSSTSGDVAHNPDAVPKAVWLGICGRGIDIYEEEDTATKTLRATFQWPNIGKLCFERKKFEIRAVGCPDSRKYTYYTSSDDKSKHLLYLCRVTHQFSMAIQPKMAELKKLEEEEEEVSRHFLDSSFYHEDSVELSLCNLRGFEGLAKSGKTLNDQRISVISNTSSNTTSGIVSDKVQSVDESEDDLDLDLMNSPPAAASLESLTLAHLREACDSPPPPGGAKIRQSNSILPRKLTDLAKLARVGRHSSSAKSPKPPPVSDAEQPERRSQRSQSFSRGRSKSQRSQAPPLPDSPASWERDVTRASASWLRINGGSDVIDGISALRVDEAGCSADVDNPPQPTTADAQTDDEEQYWYTCDDDVSETGSTSADNCAGPMCEECRLVRGGSQHDCCSPRRALHHEKRPSDTSSLCVSVDHTAQNSTLSDCQSYFHSHVSSVDSSLGPVLEPAVADQVPDTPLAATVSALSSAGSLRSLRPVSKSDDDNSSVDFSVKSGLSVPDLSVGRLSNGSPKLDFTVTSAIPNTGTYPRRSTVSNTLDTDSDYVQLPPLDDGSYVFMEPVQIKAAALATVSSVTQLSATLPKTRTPVSTPASEKRAPQVPEAPTRSITPPPRPPPKPTVAPEAGARFITSKAGISILRAHASTAPNTTPSFAAPAQQLIPPPPYDIRQHPQYQSQVLQQQQQQQQSYHPAQVQAQFQSTESVPQYPFIPPPLPFSQQDTFAMDPPPPPPYPAHLQQVQPCPLTTANLGLHLSGSLNHAPESPNLGHIATAYPAYVEDVTSLSEDKASSSYGSIDPANVAVIGKNNYLDVRASSTLSRRPKQQQPQTPQPPIPSQPANYEQYLGIPPPPQYPGKPTLATVYTNQVTQSQIEQFKAQLYSDVDYVIYPHKDPAVSRQEYMDVKQGELLAQAQSMASLSDAEASYLPPPPPYRAPKSSSVYQSAPSIYAPLSQTSSNSNGPTLVKMTAPQQQLLGYNIRQAAAHYASNQSLSSSNYSSSYSTSNYSSNYSAQVPMSYVPYPCLNAKYLSCQSLASSHSSNPSGYSASTQSLTGSYEPIGAARKFSQPLLSRVHSEESILAYDVSQVTTLSSALARQEASRLLLPPPPPYRKQSLDPMLQSTSSSSTTNATSTDTGISSESDRETKSDKDGIDMKTLREKSRTLDLPLISALCNDPSLMVQTKRTKSSASAANAASGQNPPVPSIQSMPLPPTPLEAAQGKTTGQPPARSPSQQQPAYVMPKHPASSTLENAPRRLTMHPTRRAVGSSASSRPVSWHLENGGSQSWSTVNIPVETAQQTQQQSSDSDKNAPPVPPLPNINSVFEAKLQQLQKAAVAIATGPGSIIAEDGKIAKALNIPAFSKSVKNSYTVSPSRKYPVSGLYAVTELRKPYAGSKKVTPSAFSHPHNTSTVGSSKPTNTSHPVTNGKPGFSVVP